MKWGGGGGGEGRGGDGTLVGCLEVIFTPAPPAFCRRLAVGFKSWNCQISVVFRREPLLSCRSEKCRRILTHRGLPAAIFTQRTASFSCHRSVLFPWYLPHFNLFLQFCFTVPPRRECYPTAILSELSHCPRFGPVKFVTTLDPALLQWLSQ